MLRDSLFWRKLKQSANVRLTFIDKSKLIRGISQATWTYYDVPIFFTSFMWENGLLTIKIK